MDETNALEVELFDGEGYPVRIELRAEGGRVAVVARRAAEVADATVHETGLDESTEGRLANAVRQFLRQHALTQAEAARWLTKAAAEGRELPRKRYTQQDVSRFTFRPGVPNARTIAADEMAVLERAVGAWPGSLRVLAGLAAESEALVPAAIDRDPFLDEPMRAVLRDVYRSMCRHLRPPASGR